MQIKEMQKIKELFGGAGSVHDDEEEEDGDQDVDQYGDSDGRVENVMMMVKMSRRTMVSRRRMVRWRALSIRHK